MSEQLKRLLYPYMAPKGDADDGEGGGEGEDRGDTLEDEGEGEGADKDTKEKKDADEEEDDGEGDGDGAGEGAKDKKDGEEEDDGEDDKGKKPMPTMIPAARFNELNLKSKNTIAALQKTIDQMQKGVAKETEAKTVSDIKAVIEKLDTEVEALQADGKNKEALVKIKEIRELDREINRITASSLSAHAQAVAVEQVRFDMTVDQLEEQFPQLDPDSAEYDEAQVEEVQFLRESFEKNGMSSSKAIAKAVEYVLVRKVAAEDDSADGDKPELKKGLRDELAADRKKKAVDRNLKDSKKLPPRGDGKGVDSDKKGGGPTDTKDMTDEELEALPESTKARARGDFI
jgi:hypothetical protein